MKVFLAILSLVSFSTTVFAADSCANTVKEIAKMNLDSKAKAYGFAESSLIESSLKQMSTNKEGSMVYSIGGDIYKAEYSVEVKMDSSCGVESIVITEVGL
jgi:hypothetical protein